MTKKRFFRVQKKRHQVSHSTVNRIIHKFYKSQSLNLNYLPKNLYFYEFKSVKSAEEAYHVICLW